LKHEVINLQEDFVSQDEMMAEAVKADLFLWTRTWRGLVDHTHLAKLREMGIPTVALHEDLYLGLTREKDMPGDPFWAVDHIFTADGDPACQEVFKAMGINHHWLPPAVFQDEVYEQDLPKTLDLGFIGSIAGYHYEWPYREQLISWLRRNYRNRFQIFGPQVNQMVRGAELNRLCAQTKIIIGDSLCLGFTHENYWSDRIPNLVGRGGFLIHPRINGLDNYFILDGPNKELVTYEFGNFTQLADLIQHYYINDAEREAVRHRGFIRVQRDHTWMTRLEEMFAVLRDEGAID
jgi:hypothetical protein